MVHGDFFDSSCASPDKSIPSRPYPTSSSSTSTSSSSASSTANRAVESQKALKAHRGARGAAKKDVLQLSPLPPPPPAVAALLRPSLCKRLHPSTTSTLTSPANPVDDKESFFNVSTLQYTDEDAAKIDGDVGNAVDVTGHSTPTSLQKSHPEATKKSDSNADAKSVTGVGACGPIIKGDNDVDADEQGDFFSGLDITNISVAVSTAVPRWSIASTDLQLLPPSSTSSSSSSSSSFSCIGRPSTARNNSKRVTFSCSGIAEGEAEGECDQVDDDIQAGVMNACGDEDVECELALALAGITLGGDNDPKDECGTTGGAGRDAGERAVGGVKGGNWKRKGNPRRNTVHRIGEHILLQEALQQSSKDVIDDDDDAGAAETDAAVNRHADNEGHSCRRSGRVKRAPLKWWQLERYIYSRRTGDPLDYVLPAVVGVTEAQPATPTKPRGQGNTTTKKPRGGRKAATIQDEEEKVTAKKPRGKKHTPVSVGPSVGCHAAGAVAAAVAVAVADRSTRTMCTAPNTDVSAAGLAPENEISATKPARQQRKQRKKKHQ